ncbi:MAG: sodium transporter, partial [Elusimicrobia bacterium]|nr:sodium transporter [Elusimicrobiota bacterium]
VLWIVLGNVIGGSLLAWLILAGRAREITQKLDVMTMPEFLQERYGVKWVKVIAAMIIFVFLLPYSASVFKGLGHLFEVNFNISYGTALMFMIFITGIYLIMGGYFAVTLTDFIQGIIMITGVIVMTLILTGKAGGFFNTFAHIKQNYVLHMPPENRPGFLMLFSLIFMTSFGTWGLPQMVQKFYAIKNVRVIKTAAIVTTVFALIISFAAYFTGAMSHVFFDSVPLLGGQPAFDMIVPLLLKNYLPNAFMVLILILVLSASMSTLSSLILVSASAVAIDIHKGYINPGISQKKSLLLMRVLSSIFIILSFIIARYKFNFIVTLMSLSWGAVAGSFMAPYMYGLFWKKTTPAGMYAGMFSGLGIAVSMFFILGPDNAPIAATLAILVPFLVVPLVSCFTKPVSQEILDKIF